jgi:hypothetical protein
MNFITDFFCVELLFVIHRSTLALPPVSLLARASLCATLVEACPHSSPIANPCPLGRRLLEEGGSLLGHLLYSCVGMNRGVEICIFFSPSLSYNKFMGEQAGGAIFPQVIIILPMECKRIKIKTVTHEKSRPFCASCH